MSTSILNLKTLVAQAVPKLPKLEGTKKLADKAKKLQDEALDIEGELAITILKVLVVVVALILLAVILYFCIAFILKKIRAHRARAAMQRELDQSAGSESDSTTCELITAFDAAVEKISQSPKGERALDVLPWYLVLGPEGSGKRSLLRHSGLEFPILRGKERGIPDIQKGPTEHCDLWVSDQAVFVDLANRYIDTNTEPEDLAALLEKITKQRGEAPITGIVLNIDQIRLVEDEGRQNSRQSSLHKLGRNLRASIDRLGDLLGHQLPVYVFVSQCDRVPGFQPFVNTLQEEQRHQALGITLPMAPSNGEHHKQLDRGLDKLSDGLYEHVTRTIANADPELDAETLFSFPQHFSNLRDGIGHFTTALLHNNGRSEPLYLRGVYFASAQQEQDALEHLLRSRGRSSARSNVAHDQDGPAQSGLFTQGVFLDVIFPDRAFSQQTGRYQEQRMRHTLMWSIGIGTAALALVVIPWNAASDYQDLEKSAIEHVRRLDSGQQPLAKYQSRNAVETYRSMASLEDRLDTLNGVKIAGLTWGMSNHSEIQPAYSDFTHRVVTHWAKEWMHDLVQQDREFLQSIVQRYGESLRELRGAPLRSTYSALGRYLLLTNADGQPARTEKQRQWLETHLKTEQEQLEKHHQQNHRKSLAPSGLAARLAETIVRNDGLRQSGDPNLIRRVRRLLKDVESDHTPQFIQQLVAAASATTRVHRIDITKFTDSASREFISVDPKNPAPFIPGAYTKEVWTFTVRPAIDEEVQSPNYLKTRELKTTPPIWIRGLPSEEAWHQARRSELRRAYKSAYESAWLAFINTLQIETREDEGYAYSLLEKFSDPGSTPYYPLFEMVGANSFLPFEVEPSQEDAKDAPAKTRGMPLISLQNLARFGAALPGEPRAASLPLDTYIASLGQLRDAISDQSGTAQHAHNFRKQYDKTQRTINRLVNRLPAWSGTLRRLLTNPTKVASLAVFQKRDGSLKGQWCNNIVSTFRHEFESKYPFARNDLKGSVDLDQLTNFFHPDTGILWQQVNALSDFVERKGDRFYAIAQPEQPRAINSNFIKFLDDSWRLSKALFPPGSGTPNVVMQIQSLPRSGIARTELRFGDEVLEQLNGPSIPVRFEWPSKGDSSDILLRAWFSPYQRAENPKPMGKMNPLPQNNFRELYRVLAKGDWALFKFMESAPTVSDLLEHEFTLSWRRKRQRNAPPVVLRFKMQQGVSLFFADHKDPNSKLKLFRNLARSVPDTVFNRGANNSFQCPPI